MLIYIVLFLCALALSPFFLLLFDNLKEAERINREWDRLERIRYGK